MNIVIDKSYLIGADSKSINEILSQHRLMMSDNLFNEILTSDNDSHIRKCFSKFPQKENPVDLLPSSGNLIYFEKTYHKSSVPLENHILDKRYEFNSGLCEDRSAILIKENVQNTLDEWESTTAQGAIGFAEKASTVCGWLPELKGKENISEKEKNSTIRKISEDVEFIRNVYSSLQKEILKNEKEEWPVPEIINKEWALFRYIQFHLIGTFDLFIRQTQQKKKIFNAYIDMDYCILGSLVNGLATRDKTIMKFYKSICPEKVLFN